MEHKYLVIEDRIVKGIKQDADKTAIKEIKIPEGITNIEERAFFECKSLASVVIPASVTNIGACAFFKCESLESASYGGTLAQWCALDGSGDLTEFAKNVTLAGENGLDLKKITTLKIPEGVTEIGAWAFYHCTNIENVEIPVSVTEIGEGAFDKYENLEDTMHHAGKVAYFVETRHVGSIENAIYGGTLAQWCEMEGGGYLARVAKTMTLSGENGLDLKTLTTLKIPEGVTHIGRAAFCWCDNLESVMIPEGVTSIGSDAFNWCENLKSVEIPASVTGIGFDAFNWCENIESASYGGTFAQWCELNGGGNLTYVAKSMTLKGENNLDLKKQTTLKIPEGITYIGKSAFYGCESLKSVVIPASVTSIESFAFYWCKSLESVAIPEGVTSIEWFAFYGCESLKSVEISASVTHIGARVFEDCKSLVNVTIPASITNISNSMFEDCKSLKSVTIPAGITGIGEQAFCDCESLESIEIPSSVTRIGNCAFHRCKALKSVNYGGTKEQWKKIQVGRGAIDGFVVHCTDGDITEAGESCGT